METYGEMLQFLGNQPGAVAITVLNAILAALFLAIVGGWLPLMVLRRSAASVDADAAPSREGALSLIELLPLAVGGGLILTVTLGTASAFLFKQLWPGMAAASAAGLVTGALLIKSLWRDRPASGIGGWMLAVITAVPFLLGFWHHVFMAFPAEGPNGEVLLFGDLYRDSGFHVYMASIVRETGLPLRDLFGSPVHEYAPVTHTGHAVLIGGLADVLWTSPYRASTALWIVSMTLLAWSAAALLSRESVPKGFVLVGSLCPLVLGPVTVPAIAIFTNPALALTQLTFGSVTAARMYWNLPQALSTALVAVGLVCLDRYCRARSGRSDQTKWLFLTGAAIVASGWIKPSLVVFYGPALLIALVVHRASFREIAMSVGLLMVGVAVYLLPAWLVTVADHPSWSLRPSFEQTQRVVSFLALGCGPALLLSIKPLRNLLSCVVRKCDPEPLTLALVAMGGSLLFALLFREDRFAIEAFSVFQPNLWWGASAGMVLLVPLLLRSVAHRIAADNRADWGVIAGLILGCVQIASGTLFAVAYPAVFGRVYPQVDVEILQTVRERTPAETRVLVDPVLEHELLGFTDLAGFVARPTLFATSYMSEGEEAILVSWHELFQEPFKTEGTGWADYDAAVLSGRKESNAARDALSARGWTTEELPDDFQLWRRPVSERGTSVP